MSEHAALTRLTGSGNGACREKDCPHVYRDETDGGIVVQGDQCAARDLPSDVQDGRLVEVLASAAAVAELTNRTACNALLEVCRLLDSMAPAL
ncbi:hypothetical protein [Streptomyces syringium]|uniref:hypothetical protein n=1 Tax=Streptomyces syringium TaxID=76729 RepID=UPI0037CF7A7A